MDSAVSHNITGDLNNLFIHLEYDATKINQKNFHSQRYTMCPKSLQKSYYVHHFTSHNNAPIEFHFFSCKGRDLGGDSSKRCI